MKRFVLALCIGSFMLLTSGCANAPASELAIHSAWARPGIAGGNSAIYFSINNATQQNDTLLEARTPVAENVELHQTTMRDDGAMSMQQQASVPIPAGTLLEFKPGGLHVMLIDLHADLQAGQKIEVELQFERGGTVQLEVDVKEGPGEH